MSIFMSSMPALGLRLQAAGVERDALADEDDVRVRPAAVVGRLDQARRAGRALPDAEDPAEAPAGELLLVEDA